MICTPWGYRVARVKKFKINVTSHLKIIIFIIKDIQISKCDIIFEMADFGPLKGEGYPFCHTLQGVFCHTLQIMSQGVWVPYLEL